MVPGYTGINDNELFPCAYAEYQELRPNSTFWDDFTIADAYGQEGVKDTFSRAFEWKSDFKMFAELTAVLNHKIWQHWHNGNMKLSKLYDSLWRKADDYWHENFKDEELSYIWHVLD